MRPHRLEDQQRRRPRSTGSARPGDIADVVVFLCSDMARFVTGRISSPTAA